jgi:hypothetical protein
MVARTNGWIADPTCSNVLGYDYNEEVRKQKQAKDNAEVAGNPLMGIDPESEEDDMKEEEDDLMASLTPEEKATMAKKAEDMMAMAGKGGGNGNGKKQPVPPTPEEE